MSSAGASDIVDLIGSIYDTVIDPMLWPDVLEQIRQRLTFHNSMLGVHGLPGGATVIQASAGVSPEYLTLATRYQDSLLDCWGGAARLSRFALEEPVIQSEAAAGIDYTDLPYYRDWARPQGIIDAVAMTLARDGTMLGSLAFGRHESVPAVSAFELEALRLLAPHIRRAVTISRLLGVAVDVAATFEAALEATSTGVVLVDDGVHILHANGAAEAMLAAGDPLRGRGTQLALREELFAGQLQAAVQAAEDEASLGRRGFGLPTRRLDGEPITVSVMPLEKRRSRGSLAAAATAAVFVADAAGPAEIPADALRLLYELTPAEQRVFGLVVEGRGTGEIASELGIGTGTVRTHLLRVFEKTGRRNRADLVRLSRELVPPG